MIDFEQAELPPPRSDAPLFTGTIVGTILLLILLGWLVLSAQTAETERTEANRLEIHTLNILAANDAILRAAQDSETGQRGFLLTGNVEFLEPYDDGRRALPRAVARLRQLAQGNPDIAADVERIDELAGDRLEQMQTSIEMFRNGAFDDAETVEFLRNGKQTMDGLRQAVADIERDERDLLVAQQEVAQEATRRAEQWRGLLVGFTIVLALLCAVAIFAVLKAWRMAQEHRLLQDSNFRIHEGRRLLQAIMDSSNDAIFVKDREGRVIFGNALLREIVARPLSELKGIPLPPTEDPEEARQMLEADRAVMEKGEQRRIEENIVFRGQRRVFITEKTPWLRDGKVVGMIGISRDVTDRRMRETMLEERVAERTAQLQSALNDLQREMAERENAEAAVRQMQKLENLGQLTGGIAHDFNNMLSIIIGSLAMARRRIPKGADPKLLGAIDNAEEGASRAADLTARLLAFARQQPLDPQPVEVNALLKRTIKLLSRTLGGMVQLDLRLDPDAGWIAVDATQLENALVNLAVNARDAMRDGGTLTIASRADGAFAAIDVIDTGEGMPPEICERVFEPFFTTKPVGKGTGLGLSQVHGFVVQSGGRIDIESLPGKGTTISLRIPMIDPPATQSEQALEIESSGEGKATILLVEDEPLVRKATEDELKALGYRVVTASNGAEALDRLAADSEIDLLLTDVSMPEMDGRTLASKAVSSNPDLCVVLTSGYDPTEARDGHFPMLPKPYLAAELASTIRKSLASAPARADRN